MWRRGASGFSKRNPLRKRAPSSQTGESRRRLGLSADRRWLVKVYFWWKPQMANNLEYKGGSAITRTSAGSIHGLLLFLTAMGCCQRPREAGAVSSPASSSAMASIEAVDRPRQAREEELLSLWRSPKATPDERAAALNRWLAPETNVATAIALLGSHGVLSRDHGPSSVVGVGKDDARQGRLYEKLWLEYDVPGGSVGLRFGNQGETTNEWSFEHASASRSATDPRTNPGE